MDRITQIIKRTGEIVPFDRSKIERAIYKSTAAVGAHDRALAENLAAQVVRLLEETGDTPSVEEIQDLVERVLIENGQAQTAKAYIVYRQERARQRQGEHERRLQGERIPWKTMWHTLVWNLDHDCQSVQGLNRHLRAGSFTTLVADAEAAYEENLHATARAILEARDRLRLVVIAGPSSSGKTTATAKLREALAAAGLGVVPLNLDNYFFDLHLHPQDESGDYDFETPEALDLGLINEHLCLLLAGKEVPVPRYDFERGRRSDTGTRLRLGARDLLLLDTLHGLYEPLTASVDEALKFRLYIETVLQLRDTAGRWVRWTDLRLLRRMLRDASHRGTDPARTIEHWHYVRRGELKHIIPHVGRADAIINGALPYELPILKKHLEPLLPGFLQRWQTEPRHADALARTRRIAALLHELLPADDACVPPTSVLREFIGGSAYGVH